MLKGNRPCRQNAGKEGTYLERGKHNTEKEELGIQNFID